MRQVSERYDLLRAGGRVLGNRMRFFKDRIRGNWRKLFCVRNALLLAVLVFGYWAWGVHETRERANMLSITLYWGRLAPLPDTAQNFEITAEGGIFTTEYNASFRAPMVDIESWLRASPGTNEAQVVKISETVQKYQISPGGGANFAEVTVDEITGTVKIHVFWS